MTTIIAFIVLLGILIFVHEFGHFIFAKTLGVKVERFSLGFGPKIVGFQRGETEYRISAFPLGGYVKMLGENPDEDEDSEPLSEEDQRRSFSNQPIWKRAVIVLAGPLFNIIFAAVVFVPLFLYGVPVPYPDVGEVVKGSPAEQAGFAVGDRVLAINNSPIEDFVEIRTIVSSSPEEPLLFKVKRGEEIIDIHVTPGKKTDYDYFGEEFNIGYIGIGELIAPVIGSVDWRTPADKAGLEHGDRIIEIDGKKIKMWQDMTEIIHASPGKELEFSIQRGDKTFKRNITPMMQKIRGIDKEIGLIGIRPKKNELYKKLATGTAIKTGLSKTAEVSVLTVVVLVKLIQRALPADNLGGPIMIAQMAGQQAVMGLWHYFWLLGAISINLGIINLFPIPILDGGLLTFMGIEAVRKKPLSDSAMVLAQKIGLLIILLLMALVFYNDILRLITGRWLP